ncbi:hypothetical protein D9M68_403440 [compost metagenome]
MGEPRVEAFAIGAVAVQVERRRLAGGEHLAARHQADRHLRAVRRGGPQAAALIGVGVEWAFHRGFLEHLLRAAGEVELADLRRAVERLVAQADHRAVEFQAVLHVQAVGRVRQLHAARRLAGGAHFDDRQAAFAQAEDDGVAVEGDFIEHHLRVVADQLAPVGALRRGVGGGIQGEVDASLVAAHQPGPVAVQAAVVGVVLVAFLARRQAAEGVRGSLGVQHPGLAGGLAVEQQEQLALGAGAVAVQEEAPVAFLEHQLGARAAEAVAVQPVRAVGVVEGGEEQRLAVVGPGHAAVAVVEGQGGDVAAGQVLDVQPVDLVAAGVQAVGQLAVVRADAEGAERQVAACGQGVGVEQQLLGALVHGQRIVRRARAAVVARVFVAGGGARVVQPGAPGRGQRQVGLADARLDLLEQLFAQFGLVGQLGFEVGVLGLQVIEHLRRVAVFQPAIGIGTGLEAGDGGVGHGQTPRR